LSKLKFHTRSLEYHNIRHPGGAFVTPEGFNPGRDPFSGLKLLG
jgi:hypothetical protein